MFCIPGITIMYLVANMKDIVNYNNAPILHGLGQD